jgi:hypothetical protein
MRTDKLVGNSMTVQKKKKKKKKLGGNLALQIFDF